MAMSRLARLPSAPAFRPISNNGAGRVGSIPALNHASIDTAQLRTSKGPAPALNRLLPTLTEHTFETYRQDRDFRAEIRVDVRFDCAITLD